MSTVEFQRLYGTEEQCRAALARSFNDQGTRDTFLEVVGVGLSEAGLTDEAVTLVRTVVGDWPRVRIATAVGTAESEAGAGLADRVAASLDRSNKAAALVEGASGRKLAHESGDGFALMFFFCSSF